MTEPDLKPRLAAILAADAAGYSRLIAMDERATIAALDEARAVFRRCIESNGGRVVDMAGDSVLAVFDLATAAVGAALAIQQKLDADASAVDDARRLRFRIGVHVGEIIEKRDGTVYGDGVNIAARLEALAAPGGIALSEAARGSVKNRVAAEFEDLGEQSVKNIADPIRVFRVKPTRESSAPPPVEVDLSLPDKPSIAVLPFTNMSGDLEQEYFTDGVTEDIITELSRFHSLFVIARNSSFTYRGKSVDVRTVSKELGVRYVLEGSIRRAANRIRVTAQLIDSVSGNHIWSERYDRMLEDVFAVQEEVTRAIVMAIAPQILSLELRKASRRRPGSMTSYELSLRAYSHAIRSAGDGDEVAARLAIREANDALALDAHDTRALVALAWAHSALLFFQLASDPARELQDIRSAVVRAVDADHLDSTALALKALPALMALRHDEYPDALAHARRAHDLNPNDTNVLALLLNLEAFGGQPEQAIEHGLQILRLSPLEPRLHFVYNGMAAAAFVAKRYEQGAEWARRAISEMPRMPQLYVQLTLCSVGMGEIAKAKDAFEQLRQIAPGFAKSRLDGKFNYSGAEVCSRAVTFFRVAAGLEDPGVVGALR